MVSLWHFWWPWDTIVAPWASVLITWSTVLVFCILRGNLGASFRHAWTLFGYSWSPCRCLVSTVGCGTGSLGPLFRKMLPKGIQNISQNRYIFIDILSCRRKWETAFRLRLRSQIKVRAPCFHSLGSDIRMIILVYRK